MKRALKKRIVDEALDRLRRRFPEYADRPDACLLRAGAVVTAARCARVRLVLQAGTCYWPRLSPELDDGIEDNAFGYRWSPDEPRHHAVLAAGLMPEMHVWAGHPKTNEIVDLSTGHFPEQCLRLTGQQWRAPRPPAWFWSYRLPPHVVYEPDRDATLLADRFLRIIGGI